MGNLGSELDGFRRDARNWLEENFPVSLRMTPDAPPDVGPGNSASRDAALWKQRLADKGWGTPLWPTEIGGGGLTPPQARILAQEMARLGAPNPMAGMGLSVLGPTLLEYGTEDQKRRHLPPIVRGDLRWCQGYSEPGAGSDLASLQTRCEDVGDHYLINGQKVWTSGAQFADWCFCLVRTDTTKKHEGISFVLVNMRQPGVEVRPIKLIAGNSPFCETFFTDARVEKDDLVGPLNGGWTIAKRLLQHERSGQSRAGAGGIPSTTASLPELAKTYIGVDAQGRIADPDLRSRITHNLMNTRAHALTLDRMAAESRGNAGPSASTSVLKNSGTWNGQDRAELIIEIMGHQGLGWEGESHDAQELQAVRSWLHGKATTIFGGSQEIQSNIISKRILGLPEGSQAG